jgi:hypothetical protein
MVEMVSLDEDHRLRISIRGHPGSRPVSTITFAQKVSSSGRLSSRAASLLELAPILLATASTRSQSSIPEFRSAGHATDT